MKRYILIEPLLFGDYHVAVYDESDSLTLDHKYYCKGYASALLTAKEIQKEEGFPLYEWETDTKKLIY